VTEEVPPDAPINPTSPLQVDPDVAPDPAVPHEAELTTLALYWNKLEFPKTLREPLHSTTSLAETENSQFVPEHPVSVVAIVIFAVETPEPAAAIVALPVIPLLKVNGIAPDSEMLDRLRPPKRSHVTVAPTCVQIRFPDEPATTDDTPAAPENTPASATMLVVSGNAKPLEASLTIRGDPLSNCTTYISNGSAAAALGVSASTVTLVPVC
jgi:hypothetical protein